MANDDKGKTPARVNGTNTTETVTGTSAGEMVDTKPGNDTASGGAGNDWVKGGQGDDAVDGGAGSDRVDGNSGNDRLIYTVGENTGANDSYDGGAGTNTLVLHMTRDEWLRDGMQADLAALLAFLGSAAPNAHGANSSAGFTFSSIGLNVRRIASVEVFVDGVQMDPRDESVTAVADDYIAATEHSIVSGDVLANDLVPDLVRSVEVVTGPALGSLALMNDGSFSYDPGMAFDSLAAGETAIVNFTYRVTDADRDDAAATSTLTITGTNDAPVANADAASTTENAAVTVDVLANDTDVDTSDTHVLDSVTIVSVTGPGEAQSESKAVTAAAGQGSVAIVDNRIQWTPASDFDYLAPGDAATVAIAYTQNDGHGGTAASTLDITVNGVNDAPILQGALSRRFSEQDAVFTLDLLQGASDVDRGAVLGAAAFAETTGKGGWTLEGNSLKVNPHHFDALNNGDIETLRFDYLVRDQHGGEVAQTLTLEVEGFTDAPSLDAAVSAGAAVNEMKIAISSEPANGEKVILRFANLPAGARMLNAQRADVSAGVDGFEGAHDFTLVLPADLDSDFDLGITVSGLNPDGSVMGTRSGTLDVVYDHDIVLDEVSFSARNQGMWASGAAPMVEWHEYLPLIGTKSQTWNAQTEEWDDTGSGAWRSGEFKLFGAQVDAQEAKNIALGVAQQTLDAAWNVFVTTSQIVDAGAQALYDGAVNTFNNAIATATSVYNEAVRVATNIFNDTVSGAERAADSVTWAIYNAAVDAARFVRDGAIAVFGWMGQWVHDQANWDYNNSVKLAADIRDFALNAVDWSVETTRSLAQDALNAANATAQWIKDRAIEAADATFKLAKDAYAVAKQLAWDAADAVYDTAQKIFDDTSAALDKIQGTTKLEIAADIYADVGVQVDFVLDSGSVDVDVDYQVTSSLQHNKTTDTLVITPQLTNQTTGQSVAFETISPNASLKAVLLYDVGVDLKVLLDSFLRVDGATIWDISPGSEGLSDSTSITTGGWGVDFENFKADIQAAAGDLNLDGLVVGAFDLIDLDSRNLQDLEVPFVGTLTEDIASVFVGVPTIETEGRADEWNPNHFVEGGLVGVNVYEVIDAIVNLVTARVDFSPELRAAYNLPSLYDSPSFAAAVSTVGTALLSTLFDALDGQSDNVPIFLIDATDETDSELYHANLFPDSVIGSTVTPDTAKFGFWTAYGESNDLVRVVIDIDQAVAVIVNKIIEVAAGAASSGATVQFLAKLPDINPLDLEFGLAELLEVVEAPQATIDEITQFFDLSVGFEAADVDVYSALRFAQDFTLSIDDMVYRVKMEDGQQFLFEANAHGSLTIADASQHDANGDGTVEYDMQLLPKAMFSNDTEIGLELGYVLDFLQASLSADLKIPLGDLLSDLLQIDIPGLPPITLNLADVNLGPLLRVQGDLDIASADIFEKRFDIDIGTADVAGNVALPETDLITVLGVHNTAVV